MQAEHVNGVFTDGYKCSNFDLWRPPIVWPDNSLRFPNKPKVDFP